MAAESPQRFENHVMVPRVFIAQMLGFVATGALAILALCFGGSAVGDYLLGSAVLLISILGVSLIIKTRFQLLTLQDRIIRQEMRLRLEHLAPEDLTEMAELSLGQLIALRFASDDELPSLARQALDEKLDPRQIKQRVKDWQADYKRV